MEKKDSPANLESLPKWVCRVEGGPQDSQWTVGEVFLLQCDGISVDFSSTKLSFQLPEAQEYGLKILKVEKQTSNTLSLKVTSYLARTLNFEAVVIAEKGEPKLVIEPIQLPVKSILVNPQQKAFGPILAMKLAYPLWLWIVFGAIILVSAFWGIFKFRRKAQMRKVIEELKQHNTALGAFNQFNKDLRTLRRKNIFKENWEAEKTQRYVESLDEIFRMYLLREFFIPALDWNSKLIIKEISRTDKKRYNQYGTNLRKLLNELDRAKSEIEKVKVHGCQQLTQMAVKVSQDLWKQRKI